MQHVWQFYAIAKEDESPIMENYVTQSGRKGKVTLKILSMLKKRGFPYIHQFYIRQLR